MPVMTIIEGPRAARLLPGVCCKCGASDHHGNLTLEQGSWYCGVHSPGRRAERQARRLDQGYGRHRSTTWTAEMDRAVVDYYARSVPGRTRLLAKRFWGDERWRHRIAHRAKELGMARTREPPWSAAETSYLEHSIGRFPAKRIAKKLGRSEHAVLMRCARLGLSRRDRDFFTRNSLALVLGMDQHRISAIVKAGRLRATVWDKESPGVGPTGAPIMRITEAAVVEWLRRFPQDLDIHRVDNVWFKDFLARWLRPPSEPDVLGQVARRLPKEQGKEVKGKRGAAHGRIFGGYGASGNGHVDPATGAKLW